MAKLEGQEEWADKVFELREPLNRHSHFEVKVVLDGKTKEYAAVIGAFSGKGRTMAEALGELANRLDGARVYGSETFSSEEIKGKRLRCCEYCGEPIFFALTPNEKWMPVDGVSVPALHVKGMRCFAVLDVAGRPTVEWLSRPTGQVWIPHPDVCGTSDEPPKAPYLLERWEQNRKRVAEREVAAVKGLQDLVADLQPEGPQ